MTTRRSAPEVKPESGSDEAPDANKNALAVSQGSSDCDSAKQLLETIFRNPHSLSVCRTLAERDIRTRQMVATKCDAKKDRHPTTSQGCTSKRKGTSGVLLPPVASGVRSSTREGYLDASYRTDDGEYVPPVPLSDEAVHEYLATLRDDYFGPVDSHGQADDKLPDPAAKTHPVFETSRAQYIARQYLKHVEREGVGAWGVTASAAGKATSLSRHNVSSMDKTMQLFVAACGVETVVDESAQDAFAAEERAFVRKKEEAKMTARERMIQTSLDTVHRLLTDVVQLKHPPSTSTGGRSAYDPRRATLTNAITAACNRPPRALLHKSVATTDATVQPATTLSCSTTLAARSRTTITTMVAPSGAAQYGCDDGRGTPSPSLMQKCASPVQTHASNSLTVMGTRRGTELKKITALSRVPKPAISVREVAEEESRVMNTGAAAPLPDARFLVDVALRFLCCVMQLDFRGVCRGATLEGRDGLHGYSGGTSDHSNVRFPRVWLSAFAAVFPRFFACRCLAERLCDFTDGIDTVMAAATGASGDGEAGLAASAFATALLAHSSGAAITGSACPFHEADGTHAAFVQQQLVATCPLLFEQQASANARILKKVGANKAPGVITEAAVPSPKKAKAAPGTSTAESEMKAKIRLSQRLEAMWTGGAVPPTAASAASKSRLKQSAVSALQKYVTAVTVHALPHASASFCLSRVWYMWLPVCEATHTAITSRTSCRNAEHRHCAGVHNGLWRLDVVRAFHSVFLTTCSTSSEAAGPLPRMSLSVDEVLGAFQAFARQALTTASHAAIKEADAAECNASNANFEASDDDFDEDNSNALGSALAAAAERHAELVHRREVWVRSAQRDATAAMRSFFVQHDEDADGAWCFFEFAKALLSSTERYLSLSLADAVGVEHCGRPQVLSTVSPDEALLAARRLSTMNEPHQRPDQGLPALYHTLLVAEFFCTVCPLCADLPVFGASGDGVERSVANRIAVAAREMNGFCQQSCDVYGFVVCC